MDGGGLAWIGLKLSHGENRGSSPLGSANDFNDLVIGPRPLCPFLGSFWGINVDERRRTTPPSGPGSLHTITVSTALTPAQSVRLDRAGMLRLELDDSLLNQPFDLNKPATDQVSG